MRAAMARWKQLFRTQSGWRSRRSLIGLIGMLSLLTAATWGSLASAGSPDPRTATAEDVSELTAVFRRYERIFFDARVSGDPAKLSEVLYNDPTVELRPELIELSERYRGQVNNVLRDNASDGPIGHENGYLSVRIAYIANINYGIEAWQQEQAQARAEGRNASPINLPPGATPFQRPGASDWDPDVPVQLVNVKIGGDHATADIVFVESEELATYLDRPDPYMQHHTFTKVNGRWYISNVWSEGNP